MYLKPKHHKFAVEFLKNGNATEAAIAAGYSSKTATAQGSRLLRDSRVSVFIKSEQRNILKESGLTPDAVILQISDIAKNEKTKEADKLRALEMLCKHFGLFITAQDIIDRMDEKGMDELIDKIMARKNIFQNVA